MPAAEPVAFLSYVRSDDDHDDGRISLFRKRLEGEVRMQTGESFSIFQDRNDISWGQHWEERINKSLTSVTFLIPVITPSFFKSPACRKEFEAFFLKEQTLGVNRLILPLYYVTCDQLGDEYKKGTDSIVDVVRARNWTDWRQFRFKTFADENLASTLARLGETIKNSMKELDSIISIAAAKPTPKIESLSGLPDVVPEAEIEKKTHLLPIEQFISEREAEGNSAETIDVSAGGYHIFTTRFDEIIDASALAEPSELLRLHNYISQFVRALRKLHDRKMSSLLEGYTPAKGAEVPAVSILIDNSGSMRGSKIVHTAAWCTIIAEWMDRLTIPTEILGFTTRAWRGGQSREMWLTGGMPKNPGRLNDLRHLIYKSFSSSVAQSAPNLGVMAREGLLKENIDGEALLWATERLRAQPNKKKLLFVISDGAPVDDSTLSVNPGNFLEKHLHNVIGSISKVVTLYAIGLEYDVSRYYDRTKMAEDASQLGIVFFKLLAEDEGFKTAFVRQDVFKHLPDITSPPPRRRRP